MAFTLPSFVLWDCRFLINDMMGLLCDASRKSVKIEKEQGNTVRY